MNGMESNSRINIDAFAHWKVAKYMLSLYVEVDGSV